MTKNKLSKDQIKVSENDILGFDPEKLSVFSANESKYIELEPINVYLAGKISPNGWRQHIFDMRNIFNGSDNHELYNEHVKYNDYINIVGPFFLGCDHSCYHGEGNHGLGINLPNGCYGEDTRSEDEVVKICKIQIEKSDVIFAYINDDTCYGTLAEIGYAKALGKHIVVVFDTRKRAKNMWFIAKLANEAEWGIPYEDINTYFCDTLNKLHFEKYINI